MAKTCEDMVTLKDVRKAAETIKPFVHKTPIFKSAYFNERIGKEVFFKCENFQKTGSFKIRGSTNAIRNILLTSGSKKPIIVTHSSGNHAQAVALASKLNGLRACIVMPHTAPEVKKIAVRGYGAEIFESEPTDQSRKETAKKLMEELGSDSVLVSSSDNLDVIAGQGTIGLEILNDVPDLDAIVVPVGGGGMLSGISVAAKGINPNIKIIAAEPVNADDCAKSFAAKERIPNKNAPQTVADGLKVSIGEVTWPIIRDNITDVITVTEDEIITAMKLVYQRMKLVIEPSAAVGVAVMMTERFKTESPMLKRVCAILCGGNVDLEKLPWMKN